MFDKPTAMRDMGGTSGGMGDAKRGKMRIRKTPRNSRSEGFYI